jgi:hypothetical protein
MFNNRPTGTPKERYRGLEIHPDPYFRYSAWIPGGTRFDSGVTIAELKRRIDEGLKRIDPESPLARKLREHDPDCRPPDTGGD